MSSEKTPKNLVIFDRFYRNPSVNQTYDTLAEVVDRKYNIVANAYDLAAAVSLLIDIKDDALSTPDVIITGGLLEGELEYVDNPLLLTQTSTKIVRGLRGKREKTKTTTHLLLPIKREDSSVYLPEYSGKNAGANRLNVIRFKDSWRRHGKEVALSGFVLGHLAKELVGDKGIKVIGHASSPFGDNVPVDAFINKSDFASQLWLTEEIENSKSS